MHLLLSHKEFDRNLFAWRFIYLFNKSKKEKFATLHSHWSNYNETNNWVYLVLDAFHHRFLMLIDETVQLILCILCERVLLIAFMLCNTMMLLARIILCPSTLLVLMGSSLLIT